jgi:UDP-N-acetylmuramoylalanine--D-glutamate ligase
MAHYAAVKERLVASAETAIIGIDDSWCLAIAERCKAKHQTVIQIALDTALDTGMVLEGPSLLWTCGGDKRVVADLKAVPTLRCRHNAQNAAAAIAAVSQLGLTDDEIRAGLLTFPGLPHRLEMIGHVGRALAINDSKATNADATEKALLSFEGGLFWIVGGREKEGGIASLQALFPRVEKAYLIGEAAEHFAATLEGHVPYDRSETLDAALAHAVRDAQASHHPEPVVLLSPACASYDQFKNFEMRGDAFRHLVSAVPGFVAMKKG